MMDITAAITAFTAGKPDWRPERGVWLGRAIAGRLDSELDWDEGAGEAWARVLDGGRVVVLICMLGPLLIVTGDTAAGLADITAGLPVITVPSIDDEILECRGESLRAAFGEQGWDAIGFDMACFSAGDLWYMTV
jgi:hypothetical protein